MNLKGKEAASALYLSVYHLSYLLVARNSHQEANNSHCGAEETLVVRDAPSKQQIELKRRKASQG